MLAIDIERLARENEDFRREVVTAEHTEVVLTPGTVHRTKAEAEAAERH
jgi:hypothetical protein